MKAFLRLALVLSLVCVAVTSSEGSDRAGHPDTSLSSCVFPAIDPMVPSPVIINVTVVGATGPVGGSVVVVEIVLETGSLDPGQQLLVTGITGLNGEVEIVFQEGIGGAGTFHFQVEADGVLLCTSSTYVVDTTVPVRHHLGPDQGAVWELGYRSKVRRAPCLCLCPCYNTSRQEPVWGLQGACRAWS